MYCFVIGCLFDQFSFLFNINLTCLILLEFVNINQNEKIHFHHWSFFIVEYSLFKRLNYWYVITTNKSVDYFRLLCQLWSHLLKWITGPSHSNMWKHVKYLILMMILFMIINFISLFMIYSCYDNADVCGSVFKFALRKRLNCCFK